MHNKRNFLKCALVVVITASLALAGRPLTVDDADPVEKGHAEIEAGVYYEYNCDCKHWEFPAGIAIGIMPSLEASAGLGGQLEERSENAIKDSESSLSDVVVALKWLFWEKCPLGARHALAPSIKFPTADEDKGMGSGKNDYDLTWIISREIIPQISIHVNAGYSWIGGEEDVIHYGLAVDWLPVDLIQLVAEMFAEDSRENAAETSAIFNAGIRIIPSETITLDLAYGTGIKGETPESIATGGITIAF